LPMNLLFRVGVSGLVVGAGAYAGWFLWTNYHYPASFTAGGGDRSAAGSGGSAAGRG
jgi:hypothetical protein